MALSLLALFAVITPGIQAQAEQQPGRERSLALVRPHVIGKGTTRASKEANLLPASPRVVLYDQYDNPDPFESGTSSQVFGDGWSDFDDQAADDFVVPADQSWSVDQVDVNGYYDPKGGPADSVNVYFYADDSGLPGTLVYKETAVNYKPGPTPGSFVISINPLSLSPGAYWVSVQANQDYDTRLQWLWADRNVQSNNGAAWRNPGDGFGTGCVGWDNRGVVCGGNAKSPDQMFRLSGTVNTITPTPQAILNGHVSWQGRPAQPDPLQQLPVTLTLKLGVSEYNYSEATDVNGVFAVSVDNVPNGTYDWRVKGPQFLANSGTVTLAGSPVTNVEVGLMHTGDCNDDNAVNVSDFNILKVTFGKTIGNPGYDARADFTGDQAVNVSDFNLLKVNFGHDGAPPIGP